MKILLNYASGKFLESQFKNSQSGLAAGFNVVYQMSDAEIDSNFYENNKTILSQKRGAGYWLWKAYFVNKIIQTLSETDVLFYADSGSIFIKKMDSIFKHIQNDRRGVIAFCMAGGHIEKLWTKRDLFTHMKLNESKYTDTPQRMASFMAFRGTKFAKDLCKEYLNLATNKHLITDEPNQDGWVEAGFHDHRHDQSIWSLLTKKYDVVTLADPTQWGVHHGENTEADQYIVHTRDSK
jgi:hypothetical protein